MLHLVFRNFHAAGTTHRTASFYGPGTGPMAVSSVACTGAETRLVDCTSSTPPSYCTHAHDAGVWCMLRTGIYIYAFYVGTCIVSGYYRDTLVSLLQYTIVHHCMLQWSIFCKNKESLFPVCLFFEMLR